MKLKFIALVLFLNLGFYFLLAVRLFDYLCVNSRGKGAEFISGLLIAGTLKLVI
jgi:hypothetical protein